MEGYNKAVACTKVVDITVSLELRRTHTERVNRTKPIRGHDPLTVSEGEQGTPATCGPRALGSDAHSIYYKITAS